MRAILIIGMGAGDPEHMTIQAINALRRADVLFITDKGAEKADLAGARREICRRYAADKEFRTVILPDPERDRSPSDYTGAVDTWHGKRASLYESHFREQLADNDCGAFLVWGDPSLYDSTLRIIERIRARGTVMFEFEVIPGITAIQALTARHRIALNQIGAQVRITTGRRLAAEGGVLEGDTVVLLDGECAFTRVTDPDVEIFWGAYLGTQDEILLSGPLHTLSATIQQTRQAARERKGWIMDTYLLRKPAGPRH